MFQIQNWTSVHLHVTTYSHTTKSCEPLKYMYVQVCGYPQDECEKHQEQQLGVMSDASACSKFCLQLALVLYKNKEMHAWKKKKQLPKD